MEPENQHDFENDEQFWHEIDTVLAQPCETESLIDDTLRSYLTLATERPDFVQSDHDMRRCAFKLYSSPLFAQHATYVRKQFVHILLQEEDQVMLHMATTFLLADAREHERTFETMNEDGAFSRLVDLISRPRPDEEESLHRQFMELLYELARMQRIDDTDLTCINDDFIYYLFNIIEQVSDNVEDPYHYPVIRVLLVLNEQFMVAEHDRKGKAPDNMPLTNKVMKVLASHGSRYKTFGENIILLLNREDETSLQLLTLKLLYLLFTTEATHEYFYTNDLYVLVDILVRNLLDLPEESMPLRHTYLRVLHPLLERTQLKYPPHYKRDEVRKLLLVLAGGQLAPSEADASSASVGHFEQVDETTRRLVGRCQNVSWLKDEEPDFAVESPSEHSETTVPSSPSKSKPPALPAPRKLRKRPGSGQGFLAPQLDTARQSSLSVAEMAAQKEKPGVITPSRNPSARQGMIAAVMQKKEKPPIPKARRSALGRFKAQPPSTPELDSSVGELGSDLDLDRVQSNQSQPAASESESIDTPAKEAKKPPPAPKTRRWGRRAKEDTGTKSRSVGAGPNAGQREPGKFGTDLPSISVPNSRLQAGDSNPISESPFSPPEEKTLSPFHTDNTPAEDTQTGGHGFENGKEDGPDVIKATKKAKRISSVSAALGQAQAQALHDLEQTLERATINIDNGNSGGSSGAHQYYGHLNHQEGGRRERTLSSSPPPATPGTPAARRPILTPPGQAPMRSVPSPIATVSVSIDSDTPPRDSTSPFLSEVERMGLRVPSHENTTDEGHGADDTNHNYQIDGSSRAGQDLKVIHEEKEDGEGTEGAEEEEESSEDEWN